MIRRTTFFLLLALTAPARADVPPPPDSPDAHCSLEEQCKAGVFCPYTFRPGTKATPGKEPEGEACRSNAATKGLEARCRNGGNYSGNELFCPKGAMGTWTTPVTAPTATPIAPPPSPLASAPPPTTTSPSPDRDKAKSSCATSAGEAPGPEAAQLVGAAALALALASRRRRSWRRRRD